MIFKIDPQIKVTLSDIQLILNENTKLELSEIAIQKIESCRDFLDKKLLNSDKPIYGINTGFGSLCNVAVAANELEQLQENLVKSHACGQGEELSDELVRLMLFLKITAFSHGNSGVSIEVVQRLVFFFNEKIYPVVYTLGSLGASGDLAPLAHFSLPIIGEGEVSCMGEKYNSKIILEKFQLQPIKLRSKEGLALLNGTQFMSAHASWLCLQSEKIINAANQIAALSLEGFDGRIEPFNYALHKIRPHQGQIKIAEFFNQILDGSEIISKDKKSVQDPYSFRCIPQVHGASWDTIKYVNSVIETEINSVTDNPTIFQDEDLIISGGNFHGQPLALALDFLAIAIAELASISERRIYLLISGQRALPHFLIKDSGLNSGLMITQYTAASIVSQNKQLCTPASIDSIVSSNGQEDHVSMGANAATKCFAVAENVWRVLGIEMINAAQALDFRRPLKSSLILEDLYQKFRSVVPHLSKDEIMQPLMNKAVQFLKNL